MAATSLHILMVEVANALTPPIMARKTNARMRPYSTAVAAFSSLMMPKKRRIDLSLFLRDADVAPMDQEIAVRELRESYQKVLG